MASSSTSDENELAAYCSFTPSQEELLFGNPQVSSPESSVSHPSPTPTPSYFEEKRRSISEEALSLDGGESDDSATGKRVRPWRVPARFKRVRASGESSAKVNIPSVDTEVLGSRTEAGKKVVDTKRSEKGDGSGATGDNFENA